MVATDPTGWTSHTDDFHRGMTWKLAVRCATTASVTISTALNNGDVIDGVTLATGDRVLVKDQATGSQNGIYIVSASPARAPDMDQDSTTSVPAEEVLGAMVKVIAGTVNANTLWQTTNTTAPTLGSTTITWTQFSGGGGGMTNPMTTVGDIIVGGTVTAGVAAPARLGTPGGTTQFLRADGSYAVPAAGGGGSAADAITGQIGAGGAIIPGLQGSADVRVAGTNDDEFDTTDTSDPMTGWTTLGTPTTHDMNSTVLSHYYVKANAAAIGLVGIWKASPSMPFTMIAKISGYAVVGGNARAQIMVGVAAPGSGKMLTFGFAGNNSRFDDYVADIWTNPTTYGSNPIGVTLLAGGAHYLRMIVTSSTAIQCAVSADGHIWLDFGASLNPALTVASVGLIIDPHTSGQAIAMAVDWVRFT